MFGDSYLAERESTAGVIICRVPCRETRLTGDFPSSLPEEATRNTDRQFHDAILPENAATILASPRAVPTHVATLEFGPQTLAYGEEVSDRVRDRLSHLARTNDICPTLRI